MTEAIEPTQSNIEYSLSTIRSPMLDMTTALAVQSFFSPIEGFRDPFGLKLAGELADLLIYAEDYVRLALPYNPNSLIGERLLKGDVIFIEDVKRHDDQILNDVPILDEILTISTRFLKAEPFATGVFYQLKDGAMEAAFDYFKSYSQRRWVYGESRGFIRQFMQLHDARLIRAGKSRRIATKSLDTLETTHDLTYLLRQKDAVRDIQDLANALDVRSDDIIYLFDIVLRYSIYASKVGLENRFLHHTIRNSFHIPDMEGPIRKYCRPIINFAPIFELYIQSMSMSSSEYFERIRLIRSLVPKYGLNTAYDIKSIEENAMREFCIEAKLPSYLSKKLLSTVFDIVVAGTGVFLAQQADISLPQAVAGGVLYKMFRSQIDRAIEICRDLFVNTAIPMPSDAGKFRHLRWAVDYPLEEQIKKPRAEGALCKIELSRFVGLRTAPWSEE
jgi:hypothetical protein